MDLPDQALWDCYAGGQDEAFAEVRRRYQGELFRYLQLSLGEVGAAAAQLGRALGLARNHRGPHEGFDSLRGWLLAVATQACVPAHIPQDDGLAAWLSDLRRPKAGSEDELLREALRDIRHEVKQPFLLVVVMGLAVEEAAKACRFSVRRTERCVLRACRELAALRVFKGD